MQAAAWLDLSNYFVKGIQGGGVDNQAQLDPTTNPAVRTNTATVVSRFSCVPPSWALRGVSSRQTRDARPPIWPFRPVYREVTGRDSSTKSRGSYYAAQAVLPGKLKLAAAEIIT
jgi:hypothetical protein